MLKRYISNLFAENIFDSFEPTSVDKKFYYGLRKLKMLFHILYAGHFLHEPTINKDQLRCRGAGSVCKVNFGFYSTNVFDIFSKEEIETIKSLFSSVTGFMGSDKCRLPLYLQSQHCLRVIYSKSWCSGYTGHEQIEVQKINSCDIKTGDIFFLSPVPPTIDMKDILLTSFIKDAYKSSLAYPLSGHVQSRHIVSSKNEKGNISYYKVTDLYSNRINTLNSIIGTDVSQYISIIPEWFLDLKKCIERKEEKNGSENRFEV